MTTPVNVNDVHVVYTDSHFILIESASQEAARDLKGQVLGHYLSSEAAHEALATMKTIAVLGYPLDRK